MLVIEGMSDLEMAEAMACREGLSITADFALRVCHNLDWLSSNCLNVIGSLKGNSMGTYGHIVREKSARKAGFALVGIIRERREPMGMLID